MVGNITEFHFVDGEENLTVNSDLDSLITGLRFKESHIKARVEPEFFGMVAQKLALIADRIDDLSRIAATK